MLIYHSIYPDIIAQPIGYIDKSNNPPTLEYDPEVIKQKNLRSDKGGNSLLLPIGAGVGLHSYWDSKLGRNVNDLINDAPLGDGEDDSSLLEKKGIEKLFNFINKAPVSAETPAGIVFDDQPTPVEMVINWTNASLIVAKQAYESLEIKEKKGSKYKVSWEGQNRYDQRCEPLVIKQMKLGAQNLAILIDEIWK